MTTSIFTGRSCQAIVSGRRRRRSERFRPGKEMASCGRPEKKVLRCVELWTVGTRDLSGGSCELARTRSEMWRTFVPFWLAIKLTHLADRPRRIVGFARPGNRRRDQLQDRQLLFAQSFLQEFEFKIA